MDADRFAVVTARAFAGMDWERPLPRDGFAMDVSLPRPDRSGQKKPRPERPRFKRPWAF
ncbi:MAG: hypothetical protein ACOY3L_18035 [Pseudomonadota bacterium]